MCAIFIYMVKLFFISRMLIFKRVPVHVSNKFHLNLILLLMMKIHYFIREKIWWSDGSFLLKFTLFHTP